MVKKKNKKSKTNGNRSKLIKHNTLCYVEDLNHICKLGFINENKRDWIENTMLRLRESANCYEIEFASYLINNNVKFIHQAPFIFSGKIYFADFYIPLKHAIIEIDGLYHESEKQSKYDRFRDECFNGNKLKVVRIPNASVYNQNDLKILLSELDL